MDLARTLDRFVLQLRANGRSLHTIRQYQRHVRCLQHWLVAAGRSTSLDSIDHEVLARFLVSDRAQARPDGGPKKPTTTNALRTSLRCFFDYAHRAGFTTINPARLVRRARFAPPPPRSLTESEQKRLLRVLAEAQGAEAERDHLLFWLMLRTGIRIGSAVALDVEDVDVDCGEIWLRTTKGGIGYRVFVPKALRRQLSQHLEMLTTGALFCGQGGRRLSVRHVQRRLGMWMEKASITSPASAHSLRHSFAMRLYEKTADIALVKAALGHRSIVSTTRYASCNRARLRAAMTA